MLERLWVMLRTPAFLLVRATTHRVQGRSYDTSPTRLATAFPSFARWCPTSSDSPGVPLLGILFALAIAMRVGCGVLTLRHAAFSGWITAGNEWIPLPHRCPRSKSPARATHKGTKDIDVGAGYVSGAACYRSRFTAVAPDACRYDGARHSSSRSWSDL